MYVANQIRRKFDLLDRNLEGIIVNLFFPLPPPPFFNNYLGKKINEKQILKNSNDHCV